ncbi:MAG: TonB-dependent receptor [Saprospiraceae bacterium]
MKNTQKNFCATIRRLSLLIVFGLMSCFLFAQKNGIISGKIIDKVNGETLIGATIQLDSSTIGTVTDIEGNFKLSVAPGSYLVNILYFGYETGKVSVEVKPNEVVNLEYAMGEAKALDLKEIVVLGSAEKSSEVVMYIALKKAPYIANGITASEIRKTPDRTVGDILKRVTGASIQEGKFAIIRGMNDRYNAGYLDGAYLSSTESDRKAFAFDVVPANLIDNLLIVKAGSPDLTGDFGGGVILINTKAIPDRLSQSITLGAQYHSLTTFNNFKEYKTYSGEDFNFLSNSRNIPDFPEGSLKVATTFPTKVDKERLAEISKNFNNDWSSSFVNAVPNARFAYSIGFPVQLSGAGKLGVMFAVNYADTRRISDNTINTFDGSGQVSGFHDASYLRNINTGGIFNINYVASRTQINFRNLLNVSSDNNTIERTGTGSYADALTVINSANLLNYNKLYNGILSIKQVIGDSLFTLNASGSYSNVHRKIPDYRIVSYTITPDFPNYRLALGDFFNSSTGRFASDLNENLYSGSIELSKRFRSEGIRTEVKAGYFRQDRKRDFSGRSFVYNGNPGETVLDPALDLGANNIDATKLFLVEKSSDDIAFYNGTSALNAYFLMADQNIANKLRILYGLRLEDVDIKVENHKINSTIANINKSSLLPSANLTYFLTDKINIRACYFSSVNRPEFRELAPFSFFVFDKNAEIRGNSALKVADLNNFDVKFEIYPEGGQLLSIGGFYKHLKNPIELGLDVTQPFTTFTFQNEKAATIYGLEFEMKKRLSFIANTGFFHDLSVYTNVTLIKSKLDFKEGSQAKTDRPLQGQSPFIINARLQYDNIDNGWSCNVSLNRVGRRIGFVGVDPKFGDTRQDIYEAPRTVLDLQVGKTFNNLSIKATIGDLFHNDLIYYQDADQDGKYSGATGPDADRLMYFFTTGYTTTLSLGYTF